MLTLCVFPIYITSPLTACIMYDCREGRGVIYIGNTQSVSISFLFLFFFHQSSLYSIKIFAKYFYLLVVSIGYSIVASAARNMQPQCVVMPLLSLSHITSTVALTEHDKCYECMLVYSRRSQGNR